MSLKLTQRATIATVILILTQSAAQGNAQADTPLPIDFLSDEAPVTLVAEPRDTELPEDTLEDLGDATYEFGGRLPAPPSRARTEVRRLRRLAQRRSREARRRNPETRQASPERKIKFAMTTGVAYSLGNGGLGANVLASLGVGFEHPDGHRFDLLSEFQLVGPDSASFEYRSDRFSIDCGLRVLRLSHRAILLLHASAGLLRARSRTFDERMGASFSSVDWLAVVGGGLGVGVRVHPNISLSFRGGIRLTTPQARVVLRGATAASSTTQMRLSLAARFTI